MRPNYIYPIKEFKRNYDGDSFHLRLDCGFSIRFSAAGGCRLLGCDTPEMRGGTATSKAAAKLAKDFAYDFISEAVANDGVFQSRELDKYGRPLGDVIYQCDGKTYSLRDELIAAHLAVPYEGQAKSDIQALHEANYRWLAEQKAL